MGVGVAVGVFGVASVIGVRTGEGLEVELWPVAAGAGVMVAAGRGVAVANSTIDTGVDGGGVLVVPQITITTAISPNARAIFHRFGSKKSLM